MPRLGLDLSLASYMEEMAALLSEILWNKIAVNWSTESRAWEDIG